TQRGPAPGRTGNGAAEPDAVYELE
ncbi:MAG: hypothetical protein JWP31_888, partial [Aeromicrobium sp.]|nr:hypothetical protein [Aeromicrobium sp.]